jgi:hypothetical protein
MACSTTRGFESLTFRFSLQTVKFEGREETHAVNLLCSISIPVFHFFLALDIAAEIRLVAGKYRVLLLLTS